MARQIKFPKHIVGRLITTKSAYGSHSNMVVDCSDPEIQHITLSENQVVCKDDGGYYITDKKYIDSNLADPNRYANEKARILPQAIDTEMSKEYTDETANVI